MDDKTYIKNIQKGHKEYLNDIVEKYYTDIYRFCVYLCGEPEEAYDLTQETFLKFIAYVDYYHYHNLKAYLFMIARNTCYDFFRGKKPVTLTDEIPDEHGQTDSLLEQVENNQWLLAGLQKLSQEQREAIVLFYYGDLKLKEIAKLTSANLSTVKSRIRQGTEKLRKIMEGAEKL